MADRLWLDSDKSGSRKFGTLHDALCGEAAKHRPLKRPSEEGVERRKGFAVEEKGKKKAQEKESDVVSAVSM